MLLNIFEMKSGMKGCLYGETGQKVVITNLFFKAWPQIWEKMYFTEYKALTTLLKHLGCRIFLGIWYASRTVSFYHLLQPTAFNCILPFTI